MSQNQDFFDLPSRNDLQLKTLPNLFPKILNSYLVKKFEIEFIPNNKLSFNNWCKSLGVISILRKYKHNGLVPKLQFVNALVRETPVSRFMRVRAM